MDIRSEIFYYDENYRSCSKEDAVVAHIHHLDDEGNRIGETYGYINGKRPQMNLDFGVKRFFFESETESNTGI